MTRTVIVDAGPRKGWNTYQLLQAAKQGAEEAGSEVETVRLYDLAFTGCRSCLACKLEGKQRCRCYVNDDIAPVIDKILASDKLIIGSPIYFGQPTAELRAMTERLLFCVLSYDGGEMYFKGKIDTLFVYTMNAPAEYYEGTMRSSLIPQESSYGMLLNGEMHTYASCDTVQVKDYSRYKMGMFDPAHKAAQHDEQFPRDLENVRKLAMELCR